MREADGGKRIAEAGQDSFFRRIVARGGPGPTLLARQDAPRAVGGYAVGCHGYPRATTDRDVWIAVNKENAERTCKAVSDFGIPKDQVSPDLFLEEDKVIRMGVPPVRIEVITGASGVAFEECYRHREMVEIEGVRVDVIGLHALKKARRHVDVRRVPRTSFICHNHSIQPTPPGC